MSLKSDNSSAKPDLMRALYESFAHRAIVTGTSQDGGWYYAACQCGWKEGTTGYQSRNEAKTAHATHVATSRKEATT